MILRNYINLANDTKQSRVYKDILAVYIRVYGLRCITSNKPEIDKNLTRL